MSEKKKPLGGSILAGLTLPEPRQPRGENKILAALREARLQKAAAAAPTILTPRSRK